MHAIWVEEARAFFRKQFGAETPTEVTPFGRGLAFALGFSYDDITVPWGNDAEDWDSGAARFPFVDIDANRAWLAVVCFADTLVRGFQLLCLTGALAVAEPKALRWGCGTPPPGSCTEPAAASCASSTAGPPPTGCSTPTVASPSSPEPTSPPPAVGRRPGDTRSATVCKRLLFPQWRCRLPRR